MSGRNYIICDRVRYKVQLNYSQAAVNFPRFYEQETLKAYNRAWESTRFVEKARRSTVKPF